MADHTRGRTPRRCTRIRRSRTEQLTDLLMRVTIGELLRLLVQNAKDSLGL